MSDQIIYTRRFDKFITYTVERAVDELFQLHSYVCLTNLCQQSPYFSLNLHFSRRGT